MKKTYLIIVITIMSIYSCKAQLNELTRAEYYGIKINTVTFQSIYDTNAAVTQMKNLFGSNLQYEFENDILIEKQFWNNNFSCIFESDEGNNYHLLSLNIQNSSIIVTVKGIAVKLGDDVSLFGNNIVINTQNGDNSIVFTDEETGTTGLSFKIDILTNKVIEIEFNSF